MTSSWTSAAATLGAVNRAAVDKRKGEMPRRQDGESRTMSEAGDAWHIVVEQIGVQLDEVPEQRQQEHHLRHEAVAKADQQAERAESQYCEIQAIQRLDIAAKDGKRRLDEVDISQIVVDAADERPIGEVTGLDWRQGRGGRDRFVQDCPVVAVLEYGRVVGRRDAAVPRRPKRIENGRMTDIAQIEAVYRLRKGNRNGCLI
jgi:hypothetical protein